jgi:hypothetical protein
MTNGQATVEVFWTAFLALPSAARKGFLDRLVVDRKVRREIEDRLDNEAVNRALKNRGRISWETLKNDHRS